MEQRNLANLRHTLQLLYEDEKPALEARHGVSLSYVSWLELRTMRAIAKPPITQTEDLPPMTGVKAHIRAFGGGSHES